MANPQTSFIYTTFANNCFFAKKRDVVFRNTLPYQLSVLKETGRYDAFRLQHHPTYDDSMDHWPVPNHLFWDSDVAKWIEGACYLLHTQEDATISAAIDKLVEMIRAAQLPDGYLNIHFTVVAPGQRFTNLRDLHELYNLGHLIEAALAHHQLYKNDQLLEPVVKYVNLLCRTFGPEENQRHGYPGHPEIELALIRLYEVTNDPKHLTLARYFITERGNATGASGRHYYDIEAEERGERPFERPNYYPVRRFYEYQQAHRPLLEQDSIEGHSVRAMYLLTAVADLVRIDEAIDREGYSSAVRRLWDNMVGKKMYLTGGIGAIKQYEGFGGDYFLPQSTDEGGCYAETCAGIGVMMLAERMLQVDLDSRYSDIMELCLYNAVLTGMSCDGKKFTYVNQLASSDSDLSKRAEWFTCACCPPNMTRTLGFLGGYFWTFSADDKKKAANINVHLFGSTTLRFDVGGQSLELSQTSDFPWHGEVAYSLSGAEAVETSINIRIPSWASGWTVAPQPTCTTPTKGYLHLPASYLKQNPRFTLHLPMTPRLVSPHPYTNQDVVALARGPIIYCLEDIDNSWVDNHFKSLLFDTSASIEEALETSDSETGEKYMYLRAKGEHSFLDTTALEVRPGLEESAIERRNKGVEELKFIPYYFRANRQGKGHMRVGLRKKR